MPKSLTAKAGCAFVLSLITSPVWAEHTEDHVPKITIYPIAQGTLTVPNIKKQKETLMQTTGAVSFVDSTKYQNTYAHNLRDVLKDTPGVFVQNRYGQELRLSIRGSGIARGFHARGIEVLQDGIPTNLADGSGDYYQIDPLSLRSAEIYKGGNGLTYGASTLGGAVNFVTPTAYTATSPNALRLEGGSYGTVRANAQMASSFGDADIFVNGTMTHADGYRDHSATQYETFNSNFGYKLSPDVETRFYGGAYIIDQKLPGALSLSNVLNNPTMANATSLSGDQARNTRTERIANRTSFRADSGKLDIDTWAIHKNLYHPIFQVIDQDGWTYGIAPRYTSAFNILDKRDDLIAGLRIYGGNNKAAQYTNVSGSRGTQNLDAEQDAYNFEAYIENRYWFLPQVALMTGAKAFHNERIYADNGGLASNPNLKYDSRNYDGINPKVGLMWQPRVDVQNFIDFTRSQDVPDFTDLTQTTSTTTQFVPLKMQDAWTLEVGTRGKQGRFDWDVTAYRSWIKNELLQYTTNVSIPASTFNANDTIHQGLEVGGSMEVLHNLLSADTDDVLSLKQLWNFSDFHFVSDPQYGNNQIAGAPQHVLRTELSYKHKNGFYFTPSFDWVPEGAFADQMNTLRVPGYTLLGLQTGVQFDNGILFYIDARNLTDERYVSDISTVTNANIVSTNIFYPGDGRSVFTGIRYAF